MTDVQFGIEFFGQRNTIRYGKIGKIGKVRGAKDISHLYSHGSFPPFICVAKKV
jgi:hypothetical protein